MKRKTPKTYLLATLTACLLLSNSFAGEPNHIRQKSVVAFQHRKGSIAINIGRQPFAEFVWGDPKIKRSYFANVHAPNGLQVTRNYPPNKDDSRDHATMHPGIWLAFGELNGNDYWRNRAAVKQDKFLAKPKGGIGRGTFTIRQQYTDAKLKTVCSETCKYSLWIRPTGYLLLSDSQFESDQGNFYFGDQEEMGFGVRVATSMQVNKKMGGRILDSEGRKNGRGIWGKQAKWCDYSGPVQGKTLGLLCMPDPKNFRTCWWHARDYGLLLANPFGRRAFTRGTASKMIVKKGEVFRLRFGVLIHSGVDPTREFLETSYQDYLVVQSKLSRS